MRELHVTVITDSQNQYKYLIKPNHKMFSPPFSCCFVIYIQYQVDENEHR